MRQRMEVRAQFVVPWGVGSWCLGSNVSSLVGIHLLAAAPVLQHQHTTDWSPLASACRRHRVWSVGTGHSSPYACEPSMSACQCPRRLRGAALSRHRARRCCRPSTHRCCTHASASSTPSCSASTAACVRRGCPTGHRAAGAISSHSAAAVEPPYRRLTSRVAASKNARLASSDIVGRV